MMQIKKAIITAAGKSQRRLPLQTMVDRDGQNKTALRIVIEEILKAGIDEIAVIIWPGDQNAFAEAAGEQMNRLSFIEQKAPLGFGNAVLTGSEFVGRHPFLLVVGDHLYVDRGGKSCARQLIEIAASQQCAVSAVQRTHESKLPLYGTVGGRLVPGQKGLYEVDAVIEKPTPTEAEQRLIVAGLRAGYYLCFFGMHVLTPAIMDVLRAQDEAGARASAGSDPRRNGHLTFALAALAARERYLATELAGRRYDIGAKYGLLIAQLALALEGEERDELLTNLVELLALRDQ